MMTDVGAALCPLSDLPPQQCACRNHRGGHAPAAEPVETVGHEFTAALWGACARRCESGVRVGDRIVRADGGGYVHAQRCP